jgi:hypothetical protein
MDAIVEDQDQMLDMKEVEEDIREGAKAFTKLQHHAAEGWQHWSIAIKGFRALRSLAFSQAQTSDVQSYAYRQKISELLELKKYSVYANIDKQTRSACYKLMDSLEEIDAWYIGLPGKDQLRWQHPESMVKHAPKRLIAGGKGHNKPKNGNRKPITWEMYEALKSIALEAIEIATEYEPKAAKKLLKKLNPAAPDDDLDDI